MSDDYDYRSVPLSGVPMTCPSCAKLCAALAQAEAREAALIAAAQSTVIGFRKMVAAREAALSAARAEADATREGLIDIVDESIPIKWCRSGHELREIARAALRSGRPQGEEK